MSGAGPSRSIHSLVGVSAAITTSAPRGRRVTVFFFADKSADLIPAAAAFSKSVGRRTRSALSM